MSKTLVQIWKRVDLPFMSPPGIGTVLQKCNVQPIQLMNIFLSLHLFMFAGLWLPHGFPVINKVVPPCQLLLELFVPSPSVPWAQEPLVFREPAQLFPAPEAVLNNSERRTEIESLGEADGEKIEKPYDALWAFLGPRGRFLPKNGEQTISDLI